MVDNEELKLNPESCKGPMFLDVGPFAVGNFILAWFEVAVEFIFVGGRGDIFTNSVDKGPELIWIFEGSLEKSLDGGCKVSIVFCQKELTECVKIM